MLVRQRSMRPGSDADILQRRISFTTQAPACSSMGDSAANPTDAIEPPPST
jgi:hypothetical protein